ncbi:ATP binding protein [Aureococcus anophagefferens]|nr:ATP binding protein [Aureococcus anophagefferens]
MASRSSVVVAAVAAAVAWRVGQGVGGDELVGDDGERHPVDASRRPWASCSRELAYAAATGDDWEDALFASWLFVADPAQDAGATARAATAGLRMTVCRPRHLRLRRLRDVGGHGARVEALKLGNSAVVEQDHTLVLGYSENLRPLIAQVALANESEGGGAVVVLTDRIPIADLTKAVDFSESDAARRAKTSRRRRRSRGAGRRSASATYGACPRHGQHYLFLGWRNDIADMVAYLDEVAPPGSQLTIAAPLLIRDRDEQMVADGRGRRGPPGA